jgi:tetraacyldisaccharide 4'-kinase
MPSAKKPAWQSALLSAWAHRGTLACALWPLSLIYSFLWRLRQALYRHRLVASQQVDALVIVVGNVIAGGAGKTPTVIELVRHLRAKNLQVGVISRGYGGSAAQTLEVTPASSAQEVGDEPILIQRATGAPVFVGADRPAAARALLQRYPATQIIVSDDGLQHYALYRDLEVCVFDNRGVGNGWLLPAGPLREPWPRRSVATAGQQEGRSLVLHTGDQPTFAGARAQRHLASYAISNSGQQISLSALAEPGAKPVLALAGIAQPEVFFAMLPTAGVKVAKTLALPDHYHFDSYLRNEYEGYQLICTEKDASKLWQVAPSALAVPLVQQAEPAFWTALDNCLQELLATKASKL